MRDASRVVAAGVELRVVGEDALARHVVDLEPDPVRIERFTFYDRARQAYAVVMTGEVRKYGNVLLKKGVTP